jgi:hypothetical protein
VGIEETKAVNYILCSIAWSIYGRGLPNGEASVSIAAVLPNNSVEGKNIHLKEAQPS